MKKRSDGRFVCRWKNHFFYGSTQAEAKRNRDTYKRMVEDGMRAALVGITVHQYTLEWLPVHKASVSRKCYNDYAAQLDKLVAVIGHLYIADVKPSDIKSVFATYVGYSASTIHRAQMLYKSLFDSAQADGYIRTNPCRSEQAKPHKGTSGTHRIITDEERALILSTPHRMQCAAMIMLYAGLRRGEVLAINLD